MSTRSTRAGAKPEPGKSLVRSSGLLLLCLVAFGCRADATPQAGSRTVQSAIPPGAAHPLAAPPGGAGEAEPGVATATDWRPPSVEYPADPASDQQAPDFALSQTGLYRDALGGALAPDLIPFAPRWPFWLDGLEQRRWLRLPAGTRIDTSDMEHWQIPLGAVLFQELSLDGKRLETRLITRTGSGRADFWMGAFVWLEDESDAIFAPQGARDVRGTDHDVPAASTCWACHNGEPGRVLGLSAVQLFDPPAGVSLAELSRSNRLSHPPTPDTRIGLVGDVATVEALGYLHGNCGFCHNPAGSAWSRTGLDLHLPALAFDPATAPGYATTGGVALDAYRHPEAGLRIASGRPDASALLLRLRSDRAGEAMPPVGRHQVDVDGVDIVRRWIEQLGPVVRRDDP